MKKYILIVLALSLLGCEKEETILREYPILQTLEPIDNNETGVTLHAKVLKQGNVQTTSYGFVWNAEVLGTRQTNTIVVGENIPDGSYKIRVDDLLAKGVMYTIRAFATYSGKTIYGTPIKLKSRGSTKSSWSLALEMHQVPNGREILGEGFSDEKNGYVVFINSLSMVSPFIKKYDPDANEFVPTALHPPLQTNSSTRVALASGNNSIYSFNSGDKDVYRLSNNTWAKATSIPNSLPNLTDYVKYSYNNKIYMFGADTYSFDTHSLKFETLTPHPGSANLPVIHFTGLPRFGVGLGPKVYLLTRDKAIWAYDIITDSWSKVTQYPGRINSMIVPFAHGNKIYFGLSYYIGVGGYRDNNPWMATDLWAFDLTTKQWELQENIPGNFHDGAVFYFSLKDKLYIAHMRGNYINHFVHTDRSGVYDLWVFDPSKK